MSCTQKTSTVQYTENKHSTQNLFVAAFHLGCVRKDGDRRKKKKKKVSQKATDALSLIVKICPFSVPKASLISTRLPWNVPRLPTKSCTLLWVPGGIANRPLANHVGFSMGLKVTLLAAPNCIGVTTVWGGLRPCRSPVCNITAAA